MMQYSKSEHKLRYSFDAIGTKWQIDIYQELSKSEEDLLFSNIKERIDTFDKHYSRFRSDSLVTLMSQKEGEYDMPEDSKELFEIYYNIYLKTNGLVTPLIGNLISDAGYDAQYTLQQKKELVMPPTWEESIEFKFPKLKIKKPALLDFGAAGKGYLVDIVSKLIEDKGYNKYCVDAGGDIYYKNEKELRVGLENPNDFNQVIGVCNLQSGQSICGSAGNRRAWQNFTHIINPRTLSSPANISAVWVVANKTIIADALATCLFFVNPNKFVDKYKFDYVIVYSDGSFARSDSFNGEVFVNTVL